MNVYIRGLLHNNTGMWDVRKFSGKGCLRSFFDMVASTKS